MSGRALRMDRSGAIRRAGTGFGARRLAVDELVQPPEVLARAVAAPTRPRSPHRASVRDRARAGGSGRTAGRRYRSRTDHLSGARKIQPSSPEATRGVRSSPCMHLLIHRLDKKGLRRPIELATRCSPSMLRNADFRQEELAGHLRRASAPGLLRQAGSTPAARMAARRRGLGTSCRALSSRLRGRDRRP